MNKIIKINRISHTLPVALAAICVMGILGITGTVNAQTGSQPRAEVSIRWLPQELVAASRGDSDVPVEAELIFNEKQGVAVTFDQVKRSFIIPNMTTIEQAVEFNNLAIHPGEELHLDTTQIIPLDVFMLAIGGSFSSTITLKMEYSGVDERGNSITSVAEIPIELENLPFTENFAVGDITITSPGQGDHFGPGEKITALARIYTTGIGSVSGTWLLNGRSMGSFTQDVEGQGRIVTGVELPGDLKGKKTLQLKITQPIVKESEIIHFEMARKSAPLKSVDVFSVGPFPVMDVKSEYDEETGTHSGTGVLSMEELGQEIPIDFKGLYIVDSDGDPKLDSGTVLADVDLAVGRGPLKVEITGLLVSPEGVWIDGTIMLEPSIMTPGIGPLFLYGIQVGENGLDSKVKMEKPLEGRKGETEYIVSVEGFQIILNRETASLAVKGMITRASDPSWKSPLNISVSFGKDSSGVSGE